MNKNSGKTRASDHALPYVHCWECGTTYEEMQSLEDAAAPSGDVEAEEITDCPNCGEKLPPPLRVQPQHGWTTVGIPRI